jgi:peptidyl-prolyl cis-trans isomerase SurA
VRRPWRALGLVLLLLAGGCGWFRQSAPAPGTSPAETARGTGREPANATAPIVSRPSPPSAPGVVDRVIAVVNNDVITLSELHDALAYYLYESKEQVRPDQEEALRRRILERLVETRLQLQEATREQITAEEAEVEEELAQVQKRLKAGSRAEFEETVRAQGLTLETVKRRIREQVMIQKVVRRKVHMRISVTESEIEQYLLENREKLETGLAYQARHILLVPAAPADEPAWEAARARAEEVWAKILAGEDFAELARRYSQDPTARDGGDLGVLKQGELAEEVERRMLRLRPGEASAPFRTPLGYHLVRLEWKDSLSGEALGQAKQQIREILFRQKYAARLQAWLAEIRKRAVIDIRL